MEAFIEANLSVYGPLAVFLLLLISGFGLALGEEMVTIPAGVFIAHGRLDFLTTALCAYVAIVLADCIWFGICRHYGTPLLHRRWFKRLVHPRRMLEVKHQLERRGVWLIVMARFIPSSRTTAITVSGMFHMPFWKFTAANMCCVVFTVPIQLGVGYLLGSGMSAEKSFAELLLHVLGIVLAIVLITLMIGWWTRYRVSRRRPPRAKASWLRRFRKPMLKPADVKTNSSSGDSSTSTSTSPGRRHAPV
jgi:membrane protein DedA with SNARE-associated domain